jgi:glycosyltransferase involved in cell wall biosynthesis
MRALVVAPFYPPRPGGIERYSAGVAGELRRRGWDVDVVHGEPDGGADAVGEGPAGERLIALRSRVVASRLPVPLPTKANAAVLRQLRRQSYDLTLVQSHLFLSNLLVARAVRGGRTGRRGAVWLNHGSGHVPAGAPAVTRAIAGYEHLLARGLRATVPTAAGVSVEAAAWLSHFSVQTGASVGNAVGQVAPARTGRREGPLRVVYVGRLEPRKGALEAIGIVDALPAGTEVELTVCGDGTIADQVARAAQASARRPVLTGSVGHDEVRRHLADADVFLYPSTYPEGFPTVLLEAGAAGCAVVTYPVGGAAELLRNGGGWCVPDDAAATARLQELADRPERATAAGEVLRRTVETEYTWQPVVDRLLRLGGVSA